MRTEIEIGSNCGGLVSRVLGDVGAGTPSGAMRMHGKRKAGAVGGVNTQITGSVRGKDTNAER
jgi:hypothetical protein